MLVNIPVSNKNSITYLGDYLVIGIVLPTTQVIGESVQKSSREATVLTKK